ncbi:hypothetical protein SAMN02746062_02336 [Alysiella filiformis DSM 16848]|uniref:Uncharacterized protein n=1 Tax=Alysiella filiformis DSM 16848 TaxID=1120981 RepID=A0A286EWL0_9NEIS|nr:hypothetical protein SAMN02746062_02336 [Alysiella filiformis DSM 16848]
MFWRVTVITHKTAFACGFVGIIGQIIGIKIGKLPVFVIGQMGKTVFIGQCTQIAVEHYAQNGDDKREYAQSG